MEKVKVTKKENFERLLQIEEVKNNAELVKFIEHEIDLLNKKSLSRGKSQKDNEINSQIMGLILEVLSEQEEKITISELLKNEKIENFTYEEKNENKKITSQKASALIKKLMESGKVKREEEKSKAYFSIAE